MHMKKGLKVLAGIMGAIGVWAGASYGVVRTSLGSIFGRTSLLKYTTGLRFSDYEAKYPARYTRKPVQFPSGDLMLQGYLYGEDRGKGLIIFSHGIFAGHECYMAGIMEMVDRGYQVFGFDNTGCCESPGKDSRGLPQGVLDLSAALTYVENDPELSKKKILLFGHSWGGYSVCAVLNFPHRVDGVISVSGFTTPIVVTREMGKMLFGSISGTALPMMRVELKRRFGEYADLSALDGINNVDIPIMIMHGAGDTYVNYNGSGIINHQEKVTNPYVTFLPLDYPGRNGHNDIFLSETAKIASDEIEAKLAPLKEEYKVKEYWDLPEEVQEPIFRDVDRFVTGATNTELFDTVDRFYSGIEGPLE